MPRAKKQPPKPARRIYGGGSIGVNKDGVIRARLPARIDPKRRARQFPAGHLAEAEAWLHAALHPDAGTPVAEITLGDWCGLWWDAYVQPVMAPNSAKWYRYALAQMAPLYETPLSDVRASMLQAVAGDLSRRVDGATALGIVGVWRRCLESAIDDELIARNPAKRLTLARPVRRGPQRRLLTSEAALLRDAIVGHRYEAAYALMLGCGLRIGEILGLYWRNVDLANRRAWIEHQHTNGHWRPLPKGRNPHAVPLPAAVVAALIRHRDRQPEGTVLVMQTAHPPPRKSGRKASEPWPVSRNSVAADLNTIVAALALPHLTSHSARRGLASALIEGGASPAAVAERLGHADPGVTLRRYVLSGDDARRKADDLTEIYLSGPDPGTKTDDMGN